MVTTAEIQSLGWEHFAIASNGGSKKFKKYVGNRIFILISHADNFLYKQQGPYKEIYKEIIINEMLNWQEFPNLYKGKPKDINELKRIMGELGIDIKYQRKLKLEKINEKN